MGIKNRSTIEFEALENIDELIKLRIEKVLSIFFTAMPCKVVTYDSTKQKVTVQPLINMTLKFTEEEAELPAISDIPVAFYNSDDKSARQTFPLKKDDFGLLIFSSLSLDNYLSSKTKNTVDSESYDRNSIKDAMFFPTINPFTMPIADVLTDAIETKYGSASFRIKNKGTFALQGASFEMLERVSSSLGATIDALGSIVDALAGVVTGLNSTATGNCVNGAPLTTAAAITAASNVVNAAKDVLNTHKSELTTIKSNFDTLKE